MKVYVLSGYNDYEGGPVLGVYACKYQADRECARLQKLSNEYHQWLNHYKAAIPLPAKFDEPGANYDGYEVEEFDLIEVETK